jgi:hypothetical protein
MTMEDYTHILGKHAIRTFEVKDKDIFFVPSVRTYPYSPGTMSLQIRSTSGIGEFGGGVPRKMIACAHLTVTEARVLMEQLEAFIQSQTVAS